MVGKVTHYYNKIGVGIIELTDSDLAVGDEISIEGMHTNFQQKIQSMHVEHQAVNIARVGQVVGLKVKDRVHEKDIVYKVIKKM
ncbi:TPA: translation elongation factor-like protein [archaeon]|uniref:Translation elongation factor-like protein n=1 Tax=Candidatus Naiadarchaeum limnaeum TaxID=2756139 RepID=A0A832X5V4_9ARCH|nr:translation elongation factor-like protein [Candidatus Naiadarchaeum limnaeum]